MKVDQGSDAAFMLIVNMFLMLLGGAWSLGLIFFIVKFGVRDKNK